MESTAQEKKWGGKISTELEHISILLKPLGFVLEEEQPHIQGERFLMTREKLVLVGKQNNEKVIIKVSNKLGGKREILQEKTARDTLSKLPFSEEKILFPKEILFREVGDYTIWVSEFIKQDKVFVTHSLEDQFFTILRKFEIQESFHATTFEHLRKVQKVFRNFTAEDYLKEFANFKKIVAKYGNSDLNEDLKLAEKKLQQNTALIGVYCNYLTHTDFVPHNFRIRNKAIYMLDCSSVWFGNKYEGWARFLNYMIIHNPDLEKALSEYVKRNRNHDEYVVLQLMRIYKAGELLKYYVSSIEKTEGDLQRLTNERIKFWHKVLNALLKGKSVEDRDVKEYISKRDSLRSKEEKARQKEFAVAN